MSKFKTAPTVFASGHAFDMDYRPELFYEREEQLDQFIRHLEPALHGRPPTNIIVDGEKGSGKSSTTKHALNLLAEEMETKSHPFDTVFVTARDGSSSQQTLTQIVNSLREARDDDQIARTGYPYEGVVEKLLEELERYDGVLYVVIDEADDIANPDAILQELSRIDERGQVSGLRVGTIAILNDPTMTERLRSTTQSSFQAQRITFPPYSAEELNTILQQRSEAGFVDGVTTLNITGYCAGKCRQFGGGVRDAIKLLQDSGEVARCRQRETMNQESRSLTRADVDEAARSLTPNRVAQTVQSLSEKGQRALFTVACATAYGDTPVRTRALTRLHHSVHASHNPSERTMRTYLNTLCDRGLVSRGDMNNTSKSPESGQYYEHELSIELQTVLELLHESELHTTTQVTIPNVCKQAIHNGKLTTTGKKNVLKLY